jgi:hypothetical protein
VLLAIAPVSATSSADTLPVKHQVATVLLNPDPIDSLPSKVRHAFACVAYAESRDKVVDTNVTSGAQGKWQFLPWLWSYARTQIVGLPATPNQANEWQQDVVAWWFYTRNAGFRPEWSSDSQCF